MYLYLIYGITLWGNAPKIHLTKLITIQKKIIRMVSAAKYSAHTEPLFKTLNILKLEDVYPHQILKLCLQISTWSSISFTVTAIHAHVTQKNATSCVMGTATLLIDILTRNILKPTRSLYDFRFRSYGSHSGFRVFGDLDLDL